MPGSRVVVGGAKGDGAPGGERAGDRLALPPFRPPHLPPGERFLYQDFYSLVTAQSGKVRLSLLHLPVPDAGVGP
jgi:hypothetical protein